MIVNKKITEVKDVKTESKVISLFIKYQFLVLSSGLVVQSDYSISTYVPNCKENSFTLCSSKLTLNITKSIANFS